MSIKDLVPIILEGAKHSGATVVFDQSKPVTIPVRRVDVTKAENILGFRPSISLQQGIAETINWYKREVGSRT